MESTTTGIAVTYDEQPYVVFYVQITPDLNTGARYIPERNWRESYDKLGMYEKYERAANVKIKNKRHIESLPDTFVIRVGVIDSSYIHEHTNMKPLRTDAGGNQYVDYDSENEWDGSDVDMTWLVSHLAKIGFDPLAIYRDSSSREKVERKIKRKIETLFKKSSQISKMEIKAVLMRTGRELRDDVKDYIESGKKPKLSNTTKNLFRPAKQAVDPSLYQKGIDVALMESGQLYSAIGFSVEMIQSAHMRKYVQKMVNEEKYARQYARRRKLQSAAAQQKKSGSMSIVEMVNKITTYKKNLKAIVSIHGKDTKKWPKNLKKEFDEMTKLNAYIISHGKRVN